MAKQYEGITKDEARGTWTARYRFTPGPRGMRTKRGFKTQGAAKKWRDAQLGDIADGAAIDPRDARQTVGAMADAWLALREVDRMTRPNTFKTYQSYWHTGLSRTFEHLPLERLNRAIVMRWQTEQLARGLSPRTVSAQQTMLGQIIDYAIAADAIALNPVREVKRPKVEHLERPEIPETSTLNALIDSIEDRYRIVLDLCAFAGLRGGEARGLSVDDVIDMADGRALLRIRQQLDRNGNLVPVKGNRGVSRPRDVIVDAELAHAIREHVERYGTAQPGALIVSHTSGRPLTHSAWRRVWERAIEGAGVELSERQGAHLFRHAFASAAIAAGVDPAQLARDLGHANAHTTWAYYVHATERTDAASSAARSAIARTTARTPRLAVVK